MTRGRGRRVGWATLALAALVPAAVAGGCGVTNDPQAKEIPGNQLPFGLAETTTSSTTVAPSTTSAPVTTVAVTAAPTTTVATFTQAVYFVVAGRVRSVTRAVTERPSPETAIALLNAGPGPGEGDLANVVVPGLVQKVDRSGGTAIVSVGGAYDALDPISQLLATAQLLFTLTDLPGIGRMTFVQDGVPLPMWSPDGTQVAQSVGQDDYPTLLAAP